ncbi:MAG: hypothetical protein HZA88_10185 [Verrucomicrobia bacterium]|nr:hypothetical protein [Verrucomicrobiota bacterium]
MNRVSLSACAAALLFLNNGTGIAQTLPANNPAWARAVNLMPLINPDTDAIRGKWSIQAGKLVSDTEGWARIQIPYEPPEEYDFRIIITRSSGVNDVCQFFSQRGRPAMWIAAVNNTFCGFQMVGGKSVTGNQTTVRTENCLKIGQTATSLLQVRKNGVKAYLDGKLVSQWATDFSDASLDTPFWSMPDKRLLGVGSHKSSFVYHRIELLEITGKGRTVPRQEIITSKPQPEKQTTDVKPRSESGTQRTRVSSLADPALQKDAKNFARMQSIIKGLYVTRMGTGQRLGGAQDIFATVEPYRTGYETTWRFATTVRSDTRISLNEAAHLVKVRYPIWKAGYHIRFSYSDKYSMQSGGSAGGAMAVLFMSLFDGFQIDPTYAMTGDVTVDGKIREIGAAAEKIRGAVLEKCKIIAIPEANKENLNDLALLYSPAMLWSAQLFSIATLDDAVAVARQDRAENLAKAVALFAEVQTRLNPNSSITVLRSPQVYQPLREVLRLAPNHLSAEFMLRTANYQLSNVLSLQASMEEIWAAAGPMMFTLYSIRMTDAKKDEAASPIRIPAETVKIALDRLTWLDPRLHPKTKELKAAMADYVSSFDDLRRQTPLTAAATEKHQAKKDKLLGEINKIGTDRKILEEMMH